MCFLVDVGDKWGYIYIYTTKQTVCLHVHLTTYLSTWASGLSDRIAMCLGGRVHLYLVLVICDLIAQDTS